MQDHIYPNVCDLITEHGKEFSVYYDLLTDFNQKFNITAITEREEVYLKHFKDSVAGAPFIIGNTLADIGSGGGFPALPLKIVKPELKVTLIESNAKKCEFLKTVAKTLSLTDVTVLCGRAEDYAKDKKYRETFDNATARAVARLNKLSEYVMPFVKKGGRFLAYKGAETEEVKEAENAVKILGGKIKEDAVFDLNGNVRRIVVIEKTEKTDAIYPRQNSRILKKPL